MLNIELSDSYNLSIIVIIVGNMIMIVCNRTIVMS